MLPDLLARHLAADPSKAAAERWYLLFTPIWGLVAGLVMATGAAESWRGQPWADLAYMVFGTSLWLACLAGGYLWRAPSDRGRPWHQLAHSKLQLFLLIFACLGNYYSEYFYEILHMHYGFGARWNIHGAPAFLYPLTVVYFATYTTLISLTARALRRRIPPRLAPLAYLPACFAVAFLETLLNANPLIRRLFCYDDLPLTLTFGSLMYGLWFVVAAPFWMEIDERPHAPHSLRCAAVNALAAFMLVLCVNELIREHIAPRFTTVQRGALGLDDFGDNCLGPPPGDAP